MTSQESYTQEERLLSALAHAAVLTGAIAPVVGVIIYLTRKEKSAYAAGQGLQAAVYQLLGLLAMIIVWSCWGFFYTLTFIPLIRYPDQYQDAPPPIFWVGMASMIIPFIVMGLWGLYGLYGALRVWQGADFRYALVGRLVNEKLM
jgi:uncharacterized Tic20 family protein